MAYTRKPRIFNRPGNQRRALLRSLARSLIIHERIGTTEAKAKELRPFVERLVTYGKTGSLASRRLAIAKLGDKAAVKKLFETISPRYAERKGGYTRVVKRSVRGATDGRKLAYIAFV
jgi:large subunit ribosomal protein L17